MLETFLDSKNDVAFKKKFGTPKNKEILIHFLNDMLVFKERLPIKNVTFLKTSLDLEIAAQKTSVVDVLCEDEKGNSYVVEMHISNKKIEELSNMIEKWAYFFKNAKRTSKKDMEKMLGKDLILGQAYRELDRLSWSSTELRDYEQIEKYRGAYHASLDQKLDEGMAIGESKGKVEIAKKMLRRGRPLEEIVEDTGLTLKEIESLKNEMQ